MSRSLSRDPIDEFRKEIDRLHQEATRKLEQIRRKAIEEIDKIVQSVRLSR